MKTAISLPDDLFDEAEALASATRQSRSGLYARAIREYIARHSADRVTQALNAVYGDDDRSGIFTDEAARQVLERSEW